MLLGSIDFEFRDGVILAILIWLYFRNTWVMISLTLMVFGGIALMVFPADLYYSLIPLALTGFGLGMLFHYYQQRQYALHHEAKTPRTYTRKRNNSDT